MHPLFLIGVPMMWRAMWEPWVCFASPWSGNDQYMTAADGRHYKHTKCQ